MENVIEKEVSEINENNDQSLVAELRLNQTYLEEVIFISNLENTFIEWRIADIIWDDEEWK